MLFESIAESLVSHRFRIKRNSRIAKMIKGLSIAYVDRIENLLAEPALVCKTHDLYSGRWDNNYRFVFIYGDPLESALSVEQAVKDNGKDWFSEHQFHLRARGNYEDLFQKDVLGYQSQLENWLTQTDANIICIDFADLWSKTQGLSDFLGFEVVLPEKRPRRTKPQTSEINEDLFEFLLGVKNRLKTEYLKVAELRDTVEAVRKVGKSRS